MEGLRRSIKNYNIRVMFITLGIGLIFTLIMFKDWLPIGNVQNLNELEDINQLTTGRATITAYLFEDKYMISYEGNENNVKDSYYTIPLGTFSEDKGGYIGLHLWGKKMKTADKDWDLYWEEEDEDAFYDLVEPIRLSGHIEEMDKDNEYYLNELLKEYEEYYDESKEELEPLYKHYIFEPNRITGMGESSYCIIFLIFGIVFLGMGIYYLIEVLFGDPLRPIVKYGVTHGGTERAMAKAEYLYNNQTPSFGMRGDDEMFMFYEKNKKLLVFDPKDMLWAYEQVIKRKSGLITVGKDYSVMIKLADGTQAAIACGQNTIKQYLHCLQSVCPDIILGYSDELKRMYSKDRYRMVAEVNRRREERMRNKPNGHSDTTTSREQTDTAPALEPQNSTPIGSSLQGTENESNYEGMSYNYGTDGSEENTNIPAGDSVFSDGGFWK